jgi:hypothetical protein
MLKQVPVAKVWRLFAEIALRFAAEGNIRGPAPANAEAGTSRHVVGHTWSPLSIRETLVLKPHDDSR